MSRPGKPWRVYGGLGIYQDHRSQRAAYEAAAVIAKAGKRARIWHWEDDRWIRYDELHPKEYTHG